MNTPHRVSVIIPTYNRAHLVRQAIESVLAQTFEDFEVIVVDDGSSDHSARVVSSFSDERLIYVYQANTGLAVARNNGVATSTGEFLVFLDSDDELFPDALRQMVNALDGRPDVALIAGGCELINMKGNSLGEFVPQDGPNGFCLERCVVEIPALPSQWMIRRRSFTSVNGFDPIYSRFNAGEDLDFLVRLCLAQCQLEFIPVMVCKRRLHSNNSSANIQTVRQAVLLFSEKTWSNPSLPSAIYAMKNEADSYMYLCAAARGYGGNLLIQAKQDFERAIELDRTLIASKASRALSTLESMTVPMQWPEHLTYMRRVFGNLPPRAQPLLVYRRRAMSRVAMRVAFLAYAWGEAQLARSALLCGLWYDPSWLRNRGVRSILVQSLLGQRAQSVLRRLRLKQGSHP